MNRNLIIKRYAALARKLGKLPTSKDVVKNICSERQVGNNFETFTNLKREVLDKYPSLKELELPAKLAITDLDIFRLNEDKKSIRKANKALIEDISVLDYISKFAEKVFQGRIDNIPAPPKKKIQRTHTLMLSDLHIGADIDGEETGTGISYGRVQEARRVASIVKQAGEYKPQYRNETKLVVALLGDIIENSMHDARTGDILANQICRAIHVLSQAIGHLATKYAEIEVHCATGNHDRNTARHHGRAVHGKFDSHSTVIYFALKSAFAHVKHIKFFIPKSPLASYEVYGKKIGFTHGDTVIRTGGIYSTVNIKDLANQVNQINAGLPDLQEYAALLYGHTHISHVVYLSNGCVLLGNGGLPPPDPFAVSIGSVESNNGQFIFESVPGHAVGDIRNIKTGKSFDKDESLDQIIKPFEGL